MIRIRMQTWLVRAASYVHSARHKVGSGQMSIRTVGRASLVVGLAMAVAGCGSVAPTVSNVDPSSSPPASIAAPASTSTPVSTGPAASAAAVPTPSPVLVAQTSPEPALKVLWQIGGPTPRQDGGCCVTVAPDGKIWVSAGFDSTLWVIDSGGTYLESWGKPGTGDGQFNFVGTGGGYGAIAFDPDGTFYVADTGNHRIQKFDKDRHFVKAWGTFGTGDGQFANAADVVTDGQGHVFVADTDRLDVQEFTSDGAFVRTVVSEAAVYLMATDSNGRLYVDAGHRILIYDADGHQLPGFSLARVGAWAGGMAIDAAGRIFITTISSYNSPIRTEAIYVVDASGKVLHVWPGDADSLALDPQGGALYSSFYAEPFIRKLELPKL
jgi:sugar lactone lactonase YvrE